jgi:GntR family transcriptional regulator, transcriptional repressor for pyruvate dehydrogenase complex
VRKGSLSSLLLREILARIAGGVYPVGKRLPAERAMAVELGVSRLTLRQALAGLRRLGVLASRHGSGNYVRAFSRLELPEELGGEVVGYDPRVLRQIIEARHGLEVFTVALAARRRNGSHLAALRRELQSMREHIDDLPVFLVADMRFHGSIAEASGNPVLVKLQQSISEQQRFSQLSTAYGADEQRRTVAFHSRVLEAIEGGDPRGAERAMQSHLDDMYRYLRRRRKG